MILFNELYWPVSIFLLILFRVCGFLCDHWLFKLNNFTIKTIYSQFRKKKNLSLVPLKWGIVTPAQKPLTISITSSTVSIFFCSNVYLNPANSSFFISYLAVLFFSAELFLSWSKIFDPSGAFTHCLYNFPNYCIF